MNRNIVTAELPNGIRVICMAARKFKTISMGFFLHHELRADLATANALLPAVLERGNRRYPDNLTLRRELERLYGAELSTGILKKGERHIISCSMEMVHGRHVGEGEELLRKGFAILAAVAAEPLEDEGGFSGDYVAQEKDQLAKQIKGLINDKAVYALEKCIQAMCAGEPFGVFRLGRLEDLERLDPVSLMDHYRRILSHTPIDLYVVGDLDPEQVLAVANESFNFKREPAMEAFPGVEFYREPPEVKFQEEIMAVNQAKLVMGYRTNISYADPLYCALLMYNGILGGFPHSKLFLNVREKASLAYYVYSRLEKHKGLMMVAAGIESSDYEKAREIIEEQVADLAAGKISATEMENTRRGLINQLRVKDDNPYQMIDFHLDGAIGGRAYTVEEMIRGIEAVTPEAVQAVAGKVRLDTVYLLKGREGGAAA